MKVDYIPGASSRTAPEATACLDRCRVSVLGAGLIRTVFMSPGTRRRTKKVSAAT